MDFRSLIFLILGLGIAGFIVYLITTYIPMPAIFKTIIYVIVAIALIVFCLDSFGFLGAGTETHRNFFAR
jgi:predicted membrane channel-forming protein YqfA (hemolysin III family)